MKEEDDPVIQLSKRWATHFYREIEALPVFQVYNEKRLFTLSMDVHAYPPNPQRNLLRLDVLAAVREDNKLRQFRHYIFVVQSGRIYPELVEACLSERLVSLAHLVAEYYAQNEK